MVLGLSTDDLVVVPLGGEDRITVVELRSGYTFSAGEVAPHRFEVVTLAADAPVVAFAPDLRELLPYTTGVLSQLKVESVDERIRTVSAGGMDGFEEADPLEGFSEPVPFEGQQLDGLADEPGVHAV